MEKPWYQKIFDDGLALGKAAILSNNPDLAPAPAGSPKAATPKQPTPELSQKTMIWIGGGIAVVIGLILILKK